MDDIHIKSTSSGIYPSIPAVDYHSSVGNFEEVNLSSCMFPETYALKDTPNLGILDLFQKIRAFDR
eukprot:scaffold22419_cov148-Skeletonema_dohrnii-CCMP3373.AAC.2